MPSTRYHFAEPESLEEAESRLGVLVDETQDIESQLSNPHKTEPGTGERMSDESYRAWKYQANRALAIKRAEQRFLKRWLRVYHVFRRRRALEALDGDPTLGLLNGLYLIVKRWVRTNANVSGLTTSEKEYLEMVQHHLDEI
ncbi:hypothetical protein LCGC14_1428280 [marine sediment metagenome]|uniref:Uncharacterized protein n=1 Tax=marine sediment metagenome TaxID=412755 RepID=A0A0F9KAH3_9ZZZZ